MSEDNQKESYIEQSAKSFQDVNALIHQHLADRDWLGLRSRSLATSISLEAAELLEHYQWTDEPVGSKQDLADELADIMIYAFEFAMENRIDMVEAIERKLEKSAKKYPAEDFKSKTEEEKRQNWLDAKLKHRKNNL